MRLISLFGIVAVGGLSIALTSSACMDFGAAQKQADAWIKRQGLNATADCTTRDSDHDGYVSCTLVITEPSGEKRIEALECASRWTLNSGCRVPKMKVR